MAQGLWIPSSGVLLECGPRTRSFFRYTSVHEFNRIQPAQAVLTIGSLKIQMPAIQAALSGFSDRAMRMVSRRFGAEFAMAEVVLDEHVTLRGRLRTRIFKIGDDDRPLGG